MSKTVLITGGSGLLGRPLTRLLLNSGYNVHHLSRSLSKATEGVQTFKWDTTEMEIDPRCIDNVDIIINLAGEGIADKIWTKSRKEAIVNSRTNALQLLFNLLQDTPEHKVKAVLSSSAVGYYGDRGNELLTETSEPGTDFLANTCFAWENAADKLKDLGLRLVKFRTGVVLSTEGGALPKIAAPVKMGLATPLGSGRQWVPWIHIDDAVNLFLHAILHEEIEGAFNMAAPHPVTNSDLTRAIAQHFGKNLWLPKVPELALRVLLGEMSRVVLNSNRTSSEKVLKTGFKFKYPVIGPALNALYEQ